MWLFLPSLFIFNCLNIKNVDKYHLDVLYKKMPFLNIDTCKPTWSIEGENEAKYA